MTLSEEVVIERDRVQELLEEYRKVGPAGAFGTALFKAVIKKADGALLGGNETELSDALSELKKLK